jgi:hypothetical protein
MKRWAVAVIFSIVPGVALAFDPTPRPVRVGVLIAEDQGPGVVARYLREQLRARGVDAFDAQLTYDEMVSLENTDADFFVEIVAEDAGSAGYGGIDIGNRNGFIGLSVLVSRVAAEVRLYDGVTREILATEDLRSRKSAVLPTAAGIGSRSFFAALALPFVQDAQYRSALREAAREAAERVTVALAGR